MATPAPPCKNCSTHGLAILPVRYTVVPSDVNLALPAWASGERIKDVALGSDYHYALRTLREGFVYLFYEKGARGKNYWECFTATESGHLWKQPDPLMAQAATNVDFFCANTTGHQSARVEHLFIEQPQLCGKVWLAFSEHKWSKETLAAYKQDAALRAKRMQAVDVAAWMGSPKQAHATAATEAALNQVIEYASDYNGKLRYGRPVVALSKEDGSVDANVVSKQSMLYPLHRRFAQAGNTATALQQRMQKPQEPGEPMLIALWDAIGITHELNGYRNEAAGSAEIYRQERELQLSALDMVLGLEHILGDVAAAKQKQYQDEQLSHANTWQPSAHPDPANAEFDQHRQRWAQQKIPTSIFGPRLTGIQMSKLPPDEQRLRLANLDSDVEAFRKTRGEYYDHNMEVARADGSAKWPKYRKLLAPRYTDFQQQRDLFATSVDHLVEKRTAVLIKWLEAPLFIDTLEDFHTANLNDGLVFDDVVTQAIMGISSSPSGAKKARQWVEQAKASDKHNLLWRGMALNQQTVMTELDQVLQQAVADTKGEKRADSIAVGALIAKSMKGLCDTYKKAESLANTNAKAKTGSEVFGIKLRYFNQRKTDIWAVTFGNHIFEYFKINKPAEYIAEKTIQFMFSVRAFVNPADALKIVDAHIEDAAGVRAAIMRDLAKNGAWLDQAAIEEGKLRSQAMREAWAKIKADSTNTKTVQAMKDSRLAIVVAMLELVNFSKMGYDSYHKGDMKSYFGLAVSAMSLTSAMLDISSIPVKMMMGDTAATYQNLKLVGGVLSGAGALIGAVFDGIEASKAADKGNDCLKNLYIFKTAIGITGGLATLASSFTYSAPLISRLLGTGASEAAISFGAAGEAVIGARVLFMSIGMWITVAATGVTVLIWAVSDNDLESWCKLSAFGESHKATDAYKNAKEQQESLFKAIRYVA